jgi:hypothetical protein
MVNDLNRLLSAVGQYARAGQYHRARQLLWRVIAAAPHEEQAWLMLASVAQTIEERRAALARVLALDPAHTRARQAYLRSLETHYVRQAAQAGVFISYAHPDELFAAELAEDLRFFGVPVWLDITDMPNGSDWYEAIEAAMQRCGLLLLIASPSAARADNVRSELKRFADAGKIIIPVQRHQADLSGLNLWYPPIDFGEDYSSGLQDLIHLLSAPEPALTGSRKKAT